MGTQGVPCTLDKSTIKSALKSRKGRITWAAKDLNCTHGTLRKKIEQDPELIQLMSDLRNAFDDDLLDSAEDVLSNAMKNQKKDMTNALKSTFFILNNKGKQRGYSGQVGSSNINGISEDAIRAFIAEHPNIAQEVSRIVNAGGSSLETKQPLLDQGQRGQACQVQDELGAEGSVE